MEKNESSQLEQLDLYSIVRDILRNLWAIVLGAVAVAMIVNLSARAEFRNTYTTTATFVVTSRTSGNYVYNNLQAAATMAESYSNILGSNLLKKLVCQDLGVDSFNATMSAGAVKNTNLITLRVKADTPQNAYRIIRSVMKNVAGLTGHVSSDMVMEVLQEPNVPTSPDARFSAKSRTKRAFAAAGVVLTVLFAFLSLRKDTIRSEKELENTLDSRSLGMLYHDSALLRAPGALLRRKKYKLLITEITARFEFVERHKKIAAMVSAQAKKQDAKIILVTSVHEHEGKSTVASNLALSLAQQSHQVLLIDGDLRRPTQHRLFLEEGEKVDTSMAKLLMGKTTLMNAMRYDERRGVYLLLTDKNYANSTDIVSSENMTRLLEVARKAFDFVIIDSPPMALMADAEVLADRSDMSILVVKYDMVPAPDLNDAIDALKDCKAQFAGCILNDVRTLPGERRAVVGYGGYGHYGHYGHYGKYGKYGAYGRYGGYGGYGGYGHYAKDAGREPTVDEEEK